MKECYFVNKQTSQQLLVSVPQHYNMSWNGLSQTRTFRSWPNFFSSKWKLNFIRVICTMRHASVKFLIDFRYVTQSLFIITAVLCFLLFFLAIDRTSTDLDGQEICLGLKWWYNEQKRHSAFDRRASRWAFDPIQRRTVRTSRYYVTSFLTFFRSASSTSSVVRCADFGVWDVLSSQANFCAIQNCL